MRALAEAVSCFACTLQDLMLMSITIGPGGARALVEALRSDACTLRSLDLGDNGLEAADREALAEAQVELARRRRARHRGLLSAITLWLAPARVRAVKAVFHPDNLLLDEETGDLRPKPRAAITARPALPP